MVTLEERAELVRLAVVIISINVVEAEWPTELEVMAIVN
jgi:hypothetical protein